MMRWIDDDDGRWAYLAVAAGPYTESRPARQAVEDAARLWFAAAGFTLGEVAG
jgi:hypothetical protein